MAEINWTDESDRWLKDIYDYIAEDNPKSAVQVVEGIYNKVQILKQFQELGYRYQRRLDLHIRILVYSQYRIAYLIKKDRNIDIFGVFNGSLEIDSYLL